MDKAPMTIRVVAQRTGLSAHVIRVWERRYGAIVPERTPTRRRLYSADEVERLLLLARLTQEGRSIGTIAGLSTSVLQGLVGDAAKSRPAGVPSVSTDGVLLEQCMVAVKSLDGGMLERALTRAEVQLGSQGMLRRIAAPLCQALGDAWREGQISAAHEHLASAVLQAFLLRSERVNPLGASAPTLVIATPSGQVHALGALLVCASATNLGWRVVYLGVSLPAAEIAGAVQQQRARALALSLVYPEDDPRLSEELLRLRSLLPETCAIIVGGRAIPSYQESLERIGAQTCQDLLQLGAILDKLRRQPAV